MKLARMIYAIAIIFLPISNCFSSNLDHLNLSTLRDLHEIDLYNGGATKVTANSSQGFLNLIESLDQSEIEDVKDGVDSSFNIPYKTVLKISQTARWRDYMFGVEASDGLVAVVNNPVFPEIELFNVRSNVFFIQKSTRKFGLIFDAKISLMNRWYINESFSIEDVVEENLNIDLENGKTYTPIYLDFNISKKVERLNYRLAVRGLNFFNTDPYNYYEVNMDAKYQLNKHFRAGVKVSPLYAGDYSILDSIGGAGHFSYEIFSADVFVSKLVRKLELTLERRHLSSSLGYEQTYVSEKSELFVDNTYFRIKLKY